MFDMMGKLNEIKAKVEETRKNLENITVHGEAGDGQIKVEATAARTIDNIEIDEALLNSESKEELQDLIVVAVNRALEEGKEREESELKDAAGGMLPPGMGM